jgi:hypothetical protein
MRLGIIGAVIMLGAFALAAWSFSTAHKAGCDSRNATASLFHDVIVIASAPEKGRKPKPLTPAARLRLHEIFARIDQIRC